MELSGTLSKILNNLFPFADFMYILQQEEYSSRRLVKWLSKFFWRRNFQVREHLKYTKRVKLTLSLILALWLIPLILVSILLVNPIAIFLVFIVWMIAIPVFVLIGNTLISPYFESIKSGIRKTAAVKVAKMPNLKVVAVAGSYGKTTVKNFISQLVQYNYRTQMIPGNINTPAGIAVWINANLQSSTELLIAEVDAYEIGEIAKSCEVISADIAILTNVGDQHLERFGDESKLAEALSEVFAKSKPNARLVTTTATQAKLPQFDLGQRQFMMVDQVEGKVSNLSASNQVNLGFALQVAKLLNIPDKFIGDTVPKLELPDRRQRLTEMYGYQAIDDSYNISFTTVQAGIKAARAESQKLAKKLLVVTAGIPELAPQSKDNNRKLGEILSENAGHIVILGSMFADEIAAGVGDGGKYTKIKDLHAFLNDCLVKFPPTDWFLLVQPELGDLYY